MKLFIYIIHIVALMANLAIANECPIPEPFAQLTNEQAKLFQQAKLRHNSSDNQSISHQSGKKWTDNPNANPRTELVNLWATWCPPCRKELPFLQQLSQNKVATITLVNIDDTPEDAESTLARLNITALNTHYAKTELLDALKIQGLPASIVYHQDQTYLGVGVLKDEQSISDWLSCLKILNHKNME